MCVYSIDATSEVSTGCRLSRLVNHSKKAVAKMKVMVIDGLPHLCLFALADISAGTQVLYDYGIKNLPFEDRVSCIQCISHTALLQHSTMKLVFTTTAAKNIFVFHGLSTLLSISFPNLQRQKIKSPL